MLNLTFIKNDVRFFRVSDITPVTGNRGKGAVGKNISLSKYHYQFMSAPYMSIGRCTVTNNFRFLIKRIKGIADFEYDFSLMGIMLRVAIEDA